jgi:hypothetical protein
MKIVLQTDTAEFLDFIKNDKSVDFDKTRVVRIQENPTSYSDKGIHNEKTFEQNYYEMFNLLATFYIISQTSHFICSTSNCSLFMMLFRGHANNVHQFLNGNWLN